MLAVGCSKPHCVEFASFFLGGLDFRLLKFMGTVKITGALKKSEHIRVSGQSRSFVEANNRSASGFTLACTVGFFELP